jgi:small-conductance mechanosensitive channel
MDQVQSIWSEWEPSVVSLGLILAILAAGLIAYCVFFSVFARLVDRGDSVYLKPMVEHWRRPLCAILLLFLLNIFYPLIVLPQTALDVLSHILELFLIGSIAWLAIKTTNVLRDLILSKHEGELRENVEAKRVRTQVRILERIAVVVISVIAVSCALMTFPKIQQVGVSMLASAGIAGIVIGLAAQKSLANLLAGIQIAFTQPIRIDDAVIVQKEFGYIEEITLTYVVVRVWDNRRIILPINYFIENAFENWTRVSPDLLGTVYIYVDYDVPIQPIREELKRILEGTDLWDGKTFSLQATNVTERTVELRALMSAPNASVAWDLRCLVREKLIDLVQKKYRDAIPIDRIEIKATGPEYPPDPARTPA